MIGFTIAELAVETCHSERTIRRWIAAYTIAPISRYGRANRYDVVVILRAERDTHLNQIGGVLVGSPNL